jgi:hypothetical protein
MAEFFVVMRNDGAAITKRDLEMAAFAWDRRKVNSARLSCFRQFPHELRTFHLIWYRTVMYGGSATFSQISDLTAIQGHLISIRQKHFT